MNILCLNISSSCVNQFCGYKYIYIYMYITCDGHRWSVSAVAGLASVAANDNYNTNDLGYQLNTNDNHNTKPNGKIS